MFAEPLTLIQQLEIYVFKIDNFNFVVWLATVNLFVDSAWKIGDYNSTFIWFL
jgi:hypothetical protein